MKRNFNGVNDNKKNKKKAKRDAQLIATDLNNSLISEAPRNVDIVQFAEARSFELNAIESALKNATENTGNQRVFQSLPRHLRRRAASHNIKRIPLQFRKRAFWERKNDPNPKLPPQKPKNRKDKRKPGTIVEEYNRRSEKVKWLETHIWHSKRMKMAEKWGYKIAEYPREKGRKIIYKDEKYTCLLHDASYYQCIEIHGFVNDIKNLFNAITDLSIPSITSNRYIKGNKIGNTKIYKFMKYPFNTIVPITFLWKPILNSELKNKRMLWLWIHPSACQDVLNEIEIAKNALNIKEVKVDLIKDEIIMFQLAGPRSHAILQETLSLADTTDINKEAHKTWKNLKYLRTPATLPSGVVLGLTVNDPRLSNFRKMNKRIDEIPEKDQQTINDICNSWPENVAYSNIWNSELREELKNNKCTEDSLNKRRSEALVPGTPLEPLENDSKIPILLAQRGSTNYLVKNSKQSQELLYGWNLYIPKGWAMAFFKPLVFAGARVIGLNNIYELYFESTIPCYPYDYIETQTYKNYIEEREKEEEDTYNRKPLSKRPNYQKLGIMSPFRPPFEAYLSMIQQQFRKDEKENSSSLWVLNTPKLIDLIIEESKIESNTIDILNNKLYLEIIKQYNDHDMKISVDELQKNNDIINGFIRVSLDILGKGVVNDNSIIYLSSKNEYNKWLNYKKKDKEENSSVYNVGEFPSTASIIGFITTGHYSLNSAHAKAIGCCSIIGLKNMLQNNIQNNYKHSTFVLVRDPKGQVIRPAVLNFIS